MDILGPLIGVFLVQLPVLLIWLVGLALALARWQRHPKVSRLALIAFVGFLLSSTIDYLTTLMPITLVEQGWNFDQVGIAMAIVGLTKSVIAAVLWGLVLAAIFGWRRQETDRLEKDSP